VDDATPPTYVVPPWITHERLDDEVMAINLETGAYYALDDVAADVWTLVADGRSLDDAASVIAARYAVDEAATRADLGTLIDDLAQERLLVEGTAEPPPTGDPAVLPPLGEGRTYAAPTLNKYDDLEELLRLDPVHEVDDIGWPVPRAD
jgi:hypothetical protein